LGANLKTILIVILALATMLLSGCWPFGDIKQKDEEIAQLQIALYAQRAAREADLAFAERQAGMYVGCRQFFDLCSKETRELGQQRLKEGFAGSTSGWYWLGFVAVPGCMAIAFGAFFAILRFLHLIYLSPTREKIAQAQRVIDTADERARAVNLRTNVLEKKTGLMKKELAKLHAETKRLEKSCAVANSDCISNSSFPIEKSVLQDEQDY
jgi:hypothetical protein